MTPTCSETTRRPDAAPPGSVTSDSLLPGELPSTRQTFQCLLRGSPFPELHGLVVIDSDHELLILGVVPSYFHKQMAQETVRPLLQGRRVRNRLVVRPYRLSHRRRTVVAQRTTMEKEPSQPDFSGEFGAGLALLHAKRSEACLAGIDPDCYTQWQTI